MMDKRVLVVRAKFRRIAEKKLNEFRDYLIEYKDKEAAQLWLDEKFSKKVEGIQTDYIPSEDAFYVGDMAFYYDMSDMNRLCESILKDE